VPPAGPPGTWSATDAIGFGWNALTKNFVGVGLGIGAAAIVMSLPSVIINVGTNIMMSVLSSQLDPDVLAIMGIVPSLVGIVVNLLAQAYIMGGIVEVGLRTARGETTTVGDAFGGGKYFGAYLVGSIVNFLLVGIGFALCIVPGVIVGLGICLYGQFIVDKRLSGVDAIKASWEITKGHKVGLFVFALLAFLVLIAGYIACLVGALFASAPILVVALSYIYLRLQGEQPRLPAGT
jgi:uncharacterized membrane protein